MTAPLLMYHYPACSTCKKALRFLAERGVQPTLRDIVATPPARAELEALWRRSGLPLRRFLNTSGQSYRARGKEHWDALGEKELLDALARDGKLIRRPLLVANGGADAVLVGFSEDDYTELLAGPRRAGRELPR